MAGGRKQFFTIGGLGKKPEEKYKNVAPGVFTKFSRAHKPILGNQTRIDDDNMLNIKLRTIN